MLLICRLSVWKYLEINDSEMSCRIIICAKYHWNNFYLGRFLINLFCQITFVKSEPIVHEEAYQYMVLERPLHYITLSTLRNSRRYVFSMLKCLLAEKCTLHRVKMKKQQSGINTWYQLIRQDTLLRCVFFQVLSPSKSNRKSEGKFFLLFNC